MLSRVIARSAWQARLPALMTRATSTTSKADCAVAATKTDAFDIFENEKNPQRDHANFPRRVRPINPGVVRHLWIPEEWFAYFYPKTGVTGPYMFGASFVTYLLSKEIWVVEHEFYAGIAFFVCMGMIGSQVGESIKTKSYGLVDARDAELASIRQKEIDRCKELIAEEDKAQWMGTSYETLIEAKKENVALQLEAEYRARLKDAYTQVKKRLDYQMQTANVIRTNEQKHMVNWIINAVKSSITKKQEDDALKKCVQDLKSLQMA